MFSEFRHTLMEKWTLDFWEWLFLPFLVFFIFVICSRIKNVNLKTKNREEYHYYLWGLYAKISGVIFFVLIYVYYYGGGDTLMYYQSASSFANLFYQSPSDYFHVLFAPGTPENRSYFDYTTGYPYNYLYLDPKTCMVLRIISPLLIITGKSYLLTSVLLAFISYLGIWKLYQLFCYYYPDLKKHFAFAVLFFPSLIFWGSGILKDTLTFSGTCLLVYTTHHLLILKKKSLWSIIGLITSAFVIITVKPYIFMVLLPGTLLWVFYDRLVKIRNKLITWLLFPILLGFAGIISFMILSGLGDSLDKFSIDKALETAAETQGDLKQDYYQGASFDIGDFDGTVSGAIKLMPKALVAGLFRPFIWESASPTVLLSGVENLFILILLVITLIKTKILRFVNITIQTPLVFYSMIFSIFFAFVIGLTTSNFGALVRFKIPLIPFLISGLFIVLHENKLLIEEKLERYKHKVSK